MKLVKMFYVSLLFFLLFSVKSFAQTNEKIIAVVNQAEWCSVCKANGQRAMSAFMENNKEGEILFVTNNLTNAKSKKESAITIEKLGLTKAMKSCKASGLVCFFNATTKEPITQISVANSNEEIAKVLADVKKSSK